MREFRALATCALLALLIVVPAHAQQPGTTTDPHHPAPAAPSADVSKDATMPMMGMCRDMMAGDMMANHMAGAHSPTGMKERADMLQMRGEMMKAMGDVMMNHARRMHGATPK